MYYDTVLYCACAGSSEYARCRLDVAVERLQERRVKILGRKVGGWVGKSVRGVRGCGQHRGDWNTGEAWVVGEKKRGSRDFPHRILDKRAGRGGPGHFLNTRVFLIPIERFIEVFKTRIQNSIISGNVINNQRMMGPNLSGCLPKNTTKFGYGILHSFLHTPSNRCRAE